MTINKEQPVSDAMLKAARRECALMQIWVHDDNLERIYLAMKAASHPLRPLVERAMHELEDSDYPYHRSLGAEIRTALQGGE